MKKTSLLLICACTLFSACKDNNNDFVKVSKSDPRYFETAQNTPFIPIGYNLCSPRSNYNKPIDEHFKTVENHFKNLRDNGGNYVRLWTSHSFYEIEDEKAGQYNPEKLARIDRYMALAKKYNIRVKICLEHFRNIKNYKPTDNEFGNLSGIEKFFSRQTYNGEFKNMDEYFSSQKGKDLYFNRFMQLFKRYGNDPTVFAWELWNEQNTVSASPEIVKRWQEEMFARLSSVSKKQMIVNSYGSFSGKHSKAIYSHFYKDSANAIACIHRYIDEGAFLKECYGATDIMAADAIAQIKKIVPNKPAILAETGAVEPNHTGAWRHYKADKDSIIFHDTLYTPFFCGSAGTGEIWHWDMYVAKNKVWHHIKPFAELIKDVNPLEENFATSRTDTTNARVYAITGNKTLLAFVRDVKNDWRSEFEKGEPPREIAGEMVDFTSQLSGKKIAKVTVHNLWGGKNTEVEKSSKIKLPTFKRSCAIRIDFE